MTDADSLVQLLLDTTEDDGIALDSPSLLILGTVACVTWGGLAAAGAWVWWHWRMP